jgi:hypothetical protein
MKASAGDESQKRTLSSAVLELEDQALTANMHLMRNTSSTSINYYSYRCSSWCMTMLWKTWKGWNWKISQLPIDSQNPKWTLSSGTLYLPSYCMMWKTGRVGRLDQQTAFSIVKIVTNGINIYWRWRVWWWDDTGTVVVFWWCVAANVAIQLWIRRTHSRTDTLKGRYELTHERTH